VDVFYFVPPVVAQSASFSLPILRDASWVEESYAYRGCLARGKALINIEKDDQTFLEEYSSTNKKVAHWFGPQRELFVGGNTKYQVQFEVKHGESIIVVTGTELDYSLPLADGRSAFRPQVTLTPNEDFWVYQKINDVISLLSG
jgi:hypothetical protein